jgi:hypothetical protein
MALSVVALLRNNKSAIGAWRTSQAVRPADLWVHGLDNLDENLLTTTHEPALFGHLTYNKTWLIILG